MVDGPCKMGEVRLKGAEVGVDLLFARLFRELLECCRGRVVLVRVLGKSTKALRDFGCDSGDGCWGGIGSLEETLSCSDSIGIKGSASLIKDEFLQRCFRFCIVVRRVSVPVGFEVLYLRDERVDKGV
jgi:hypothetical protein